MLPWLWFACAPAPTPPPAQIAETARRPHEVTVDCTGAGDFATLSDAVDEAHSGDLITVAPCTYYGTLDLNGKSLRVVSSGGPAVTTIAATPGRAAVHAFGGEGARTIVKGFTLTGGGGVEAAGGIDVEMSSLRVEDCVLTGNGGENPIHGRSADLVLKNVIVDGTNTASQGSAVYLQRGYLLMVDSSVTCDPAMTHGLQLDHGAFMVDRSTVTCPGIEAVFNEHSEGRLQRSVVFGETLQLAEDSGDEMVIENTVMNGGFKTENGTFEMINCAVTGSEIDLDNPGLDSIIDNTVIRDIPGCAIRGASTWMDIRYNAFWNVTQGFCGPDRSDAGNLVADCQHTDIAGGDWTLQAGSPCIDRGRPGSEDDVDGTRTDIGVHGGPFTQSGGY